MAKGDARRFASMLPANADLQPRYGFAPKSHRLLHERSNAEPIEYLEGVIL